jgi:hypothetical protein
MRHVCALLLVCIVAVLGCAGANGRAGPRSPQPQPRLPRAITADEQISVGEKAVSLIAKSPSTGEISLAWKSVPGAAYYLLFRSGQPQIKLAFWGPDMLAPCDHKTYDDTDVERASSYYYAVVAVSENDELSLVATGRGATRAEDEPLRETSKGRRGSEPR